MPGKDGLSILHELRVAPERPVVAMLTTFDSDEYIATAPRATALRNGAAGFLLKDTDPEQLPLLRAHPCTAGGRPLTDRERRGGRQVSERRRRSGGAGPWSPCRPCRALTSSTSICCASHRAWKTGFQYTPVASIATCVTPCSTNQATGRCSTW